MISIINYGLGNLGSITNMLRYIGQPSKIVERPDELVDAEKIILPGVGAFDAGMEQLHEKGWIAPLNEAALQRRIPVLGICLGMQLMTHSSEEGNREGLKWIDGAAYRFEYDPQKKLKIPHMGWTDVEVKNPGVLFPKADEENRFYFVHSYYVKVNRQEDEMVTADYGLSYTAGFNKDNIFGVQFHPEKSHKFGMRFLERFAKI